MTSSRAAAGIPVREWVSFSSVIWWVPSSAASTTCAKWYGAWGPTRSPGLAWLWVNNWAPLSFVVLIDWIRYPSPTPAHAYSLTPMRRAAVPSGVRSGLSCGS
ncbi:hypothetical protein EES45_08510 [Streptomyces sp. ADI97-07]|nr:hypothetical protein EES45_08510 [Streptomyces sp. ADI97-07]